MKYHRLKYEMQITDQPITLNGHFKWPILSGHLLGIQSGFWKTRKMLKS